MNERPIAFNAPMMRALLDRNKSQTRRLVWPQPQPTPIGWRFVSEDAGFGWSGDPPMDYFGPICPYGQPGDHLWVQEEWGVAELSFDDPYTKAHYSADGAYRVIPGWHKATEFIGPDLSFQYCPASAMPRWASRVLLEITQLRVRWLGGITEADVAAEGFKNRADFMDCFRDIYGMPNGLDPLVWVVDFTILEVRS